MASGRQHIDAILPAPAIGPPGDFIIIRLKSLDHECVGIRIVVAVLRRFFLNEISNGFTAEEIGVHCSQQFFHGEALFVKNVVFDGHETVGESADAHSLNITGIVTGAACIVILSFGYAILNDDRQERHWHLSGVQFFNDIVTLHLDVDEVVQLLAESGKEVIKGFKGSGGTSMWAELTTAGFIKTVGKCELENFGQVEITG